MASQFDQYLESNPNERELPPDQVLEKLYREADSQDSFSEFAEKILRDPERPMGRVAPREGKREPDSPVEQPPPKQDAPAEPKRGIVERAKEGWRQGFQPEQPLGRAETKQFGTWGYNLDEAVTTAGRTIGGAIGALGGVTAGAYERLGGSRESADRLQRETKPVTDTLAGVAGVAPRSPIPRVSGKMVRAQSERNMATAMKEVDETVTALETDLKAARELGDAERIGAAEAELARVQDYRKRVNEPPRDGDPIMRQIVPHPKGPQSAVINKFDHIYTAIKDDLHPINKAVKMATGSFSGKHKFPAETDPYVQARLTRGVVGQTEHFIKYGTFDYNTLEVTGPGLREIVSPVSNRLEEAMRYAVAKRVIEKQGQQGIATGIDLKFAQDVVSRVESLAQNNPEYAALVTFQQGLVGYNKALVKYLVDAGVVAKDSAATFEAANLDYLPFYRLMDPTQISGGASKGSARGSGMNMIRAMRGSEREILDPLESMIRNTNAFLTVAAQNRARYWLTRTAEEFGLPQVAERVQYSPRAIEVADTELKGFLADHGIEATGADSFTVFRPKSWAMAGNEITVMRAGKKETWRVDPAIAEAVNKMDRGAVGDIVKMLQIPAMLLRAGATRSPDFSIKNLWQDQFTAMATTQYGYGPWDLIRSAYDLTAKDMEGYKEFLRAGGANVTQVAMDELRLEVARQNIMGRTIKEKAETVVKAPVQVLQAISNISEYATRLGGYLNARAEGASPAAAAYEARELTLDFARHGAQMRGWNLIAAFMNAQMEGVDRMGRAFATNPARASTVSFAGITLPALYLWWANHEDPRYKNLAPWEKNTYFIFLATDWKTLPSTISEAELENYRGSYPVRKKEDGQWEVNMGGVARMPKPFEQGVVFGSAIERMLDVFVDKDPDGAKGLKDAMERSFLPNPLPTAVVPIWEHMSDYNFFLSRKLTPRRLADELPRYRYSEYTSETAKKIGAALDQIPGNKNASGNSPIVIENYVRGWSGTLGVYALQGVDSLLRQFGIVEPSTKSAGTMADVPGLRRFFSRYPSASAEPISQFYEKYIEMQQTANSLQKLKRQGKTEEAAAVAAESSYAKIEPYAKALNASRKFVEAIERMPLRDPKSQDKRGFTREEKRDLIDKTYMQMILMAKQANVIMDAAAKGSTKQRAAAFKSSDLAGDERIQIFGNLNNADQDIMLKRMGPLERFSFVPYARADMKENYIAQFLKLSKEEQTRLIQQMQGQTKMFWENLVYVRGPYGGTPPTPPEGDWVRESAPGSKPQNQMRDFMKDFLKQ